jgi:solute carrier family 25 protein 33/36
MTFSTTAPSSAPAQLGNVSQLNKDIVPQSRELGDVIPDRTPAARDEKPEAKPLAHFVAGGYVSERGDDPD